MVTTDKGQEEPKHCATCEREHSNIHPCPMRVANALMTQDAHTIKQLTAEDIAWMIKNLTNIRSIVEDVIANLMALEE